MPAHRKPFHELGPIAFRLAHLLPRSVAKPLRSLPRTALDLAASAPTADWMSHAHFSCIELQGRGSGLEGEFRRIVLRRLMSVFLSTPTALFSVSPRSSLRRFDLEKVAFSESTLERPDFEVGCRVSC